MMSTFRRRFVMSVLIQIAVLGTAEAQRTRDSSATPAPPWRDSVRYGSGPSVGPPPSDFRGDHPPAKWCLQATGLASGDFSGIWIVTTRGWLRQVLSDSTRLGDTWRIVLGGAPRLADADSIVQIDDEAVCHDVASLLNRDLLGWRTGPPPVVILRVHDYLIAYPSNARLGEFGMAVGLGSGRSIRAVATW